MPSCNWYKPKRAGNNERQNMVKHVVSPWHTEFVSNSLLIAMLGYLSVSQIIHLFSTLYRWWEDRRVPAVHDGTPGSAPKGCDPPLRISFNHEEEELRKGLPYADTCANTFTIHVGLIYDKFREIMLTVLFEVRCLFSNQWVVYNKYVEGQLPAMAVSYMR